jgi:glycosyltransferase involved in cell wall biosynthesis
LAVTEFVARELERAGIERSRIDIVPDGVEIAAGSSELPPSSRIVALALHDPAKGRDLVEQAERLLERPVVYSDDVLRDLPGAGAFLYITRSEGFGSAALLAMSFGVPVIASRVGGLPEVLGEDGGLLVENQPQEISKAVQKVLEDRDFARSLVLRARQRVNKCFSKARLIERTLESYARALRG